MTRFVGSIVAMVILAKSGMPVLAIGVFGQYFLVFGIAAVVQGIKSKNFNPIVLIVPLVGIIAIAASVVWQFGAEETIEFIEENGWMVLLAVFIIMGILLEFYAVYVTVGQKRKFSQSVTATCVDILVNYDNVGKEIYFPGECYENESSNRKGIIVGILGLFFVGMPLFALYMMWRG